MRYNSVAVPSHPTLRFYSGFNPRYSEWSTNVPWYISNKILHDDLGIPYIEEDIKRLTRDHLKQLPHHPNEEAGQLHLHPEGIRRLKKLWITNALLINWLTIYNTMSLEKLECYRWMSSRFKCFYSSHLIIALNSRL